jgi:hypothetical protein
MEFFYKMEEVADDNNIVIKAIKTSNYSIIQFVFEHLRIKSPNFIFLCVEYQSNGGFEYMYNLIQDNELKDQDFVSKLITKCIECNYKYGLLKICNSYSEDEYFISYALVMALKHDNPTLLKLLINYYGLKHGTIITDRLIPFGEEHESHECLKYLNELV